MARQWLIAQIADRFHALPSVVARELEDDPERLSAECLPLLAYADAYRAYQRNDKSEMKRWKFSTLMDLVIENDHAAVEEELASGGVGEAEGEG